MSEALDIFAWLETARAGFTEGETDPFSLFHQIRSASRDYDDDAVRAGRIEFERLGQSYGQPWLGVFGRHWELQYRLTSRREGATAVADAVAAFERSHREDTIDCPQSMCAVQDLCLAYGNVDGPGYAAKTVAAATDGLARIDVHRPCWDCLSSELVGGLEHAGQHAEAAEQCVSVERQLRSIGVRPSVYYARARLQNLLDAGELARAKEFDTELVRDRYNPHSEDAWPEYDLLRGEVLLACGDEEGALSVFETCPNPVEKPRYGYRWRRLARQLLDAGVISNDDRIAGTFVRLAQHYRSVGGWRNAFDTFADAAIIAAWRGAIRSAHSARTACEELLPLLEAPVDAPRRIASINAALATAPKEIADTAPLDQEVNALEESLASEFDVESFLRLSSLLHAQGWFGAARSRLWTHVRANPDERHAAISLMQMLLTSPGPVPHNELDELADLVDGQDPVLGYWIRANTMAADERWEGCIAHCEAILGLDPMAQNTRRLLVDALRQLERHTDAADQHRKLLTSPEPEDLPDDELARRSHQDAWAAIVIGSLAQDWELAREGTTRLGIELETAEGPFDEPWEPCVLVFVDRHSGKKERLTARRTGPATAAIIQVGFREDPLRYEDRVVFEPAPLNRLPDDASEEERRTFVFEYQALATIAHGGFTGFTVEGAWPDDADLWSKLRDGLLDAGYGVWAYGAGSGHHRKSGRSREVLLFSVALPPQKRPIELVVHLEAATEFWPDTLAWPGLARAAEEGAETHETRLAEMWGLAETDSEDVG